MAGENRLNLNELLQKWPHGAVVALPWLEKQGIYQQLAYEYERSGWLKRLGSGAYIREGDSVDWLGGLYALQQHLELPVHIGGKTAFEVHQALHFIPMREPTIAFLYGTPNLKLPLWFTRQKWKRTIVYKKLNLFKKLDASKTLMTQTFQNLELTVSSLERAMFELLDSVPKLQSVEEALLLMEGLATLRSKLVQELLETCRSIKVKRLFLLLAERCNHQWFKKLDLKRVDLGKGDRLIVTGGKLDPKYRITVPKSIYQHEGNKIEQK